MANEISKTQIDKLGDRLKKGNISEEDLRVLDEYRRSFTDAYETVLEIIRSELLLQPTGRPAKSTTSISEKLRRESIRLTQMQDIAGCRVIVTEIASQEEVVRSLAHVFSGATISDRRAHPSHGYRAVHVIVNRDEKPVEIQVRTELQHLWAELSEKLSDVIDPALKYGKGLTEALTVLQGTSILINQQESNEKRLSDMMTRATSEAGMQEIHKESAQSREALLTLLREMIEDWTNLAERKRNDFSD
jgi:putative GTP pyrophosphokinase